MFLWMPSNCLSGYLFKVPSRYLSQRPPNFGAFDVGLLGDGASAEG